MKIRFKVNTLMLLMIYYCVFLNLPGFQFYNIIKYMFLVIVGIYLISNMRILIRKEFFQIHIALFLFAGVVIYSSWINRSIVKERDPFLAALVFAGALIELFLLMEVTSVKRNDKSMINVFYAVTLIVTVITDALILVGGYSNVRDGPQYLVGTKFDVAYLHLFLIALCLEKYNGAYFLQDAQKLWIIGLITSTIIFTIIIDCTTGFIGLLLIAIMLVVYNRHAQIIYNPFVFLAVLSTSFLLSFLFKYIVMWEPIEYVLVHYLKRDITLTSRTTIFMTIPLLLRGHYFLGYGYGTTYELGIKLAGFPNTQNALWEWIWQCGVWGTILLIFLMVLVIHHANKSRQIEKNNKSKYLLILVYAFSILASVEITINLSYLGYLAMLLPLTHTSKEGKGENRYAL